MKILLLIWLAAVPPDLTELAQQIERFPATKTAATESARLQRFFDLYWTARMRELPDFATYIGYAGVEDRVPDLSKEMQAFIHRLAHVELAALKSIDRAKLTESEQLNYDLARRKLELEIEGERFHETDPFHNDYLLIGPMFDRIFVPMSLIGYMPAKTVADYELILTRLRAFPRVIDDGLARLDEGLKLGITPPRVTIKNAAAEVGELIFDDPEKNYFLDKFRKIPESIPAAERERLLRQATELFRDEINPRLRKYEKYLAETYVPGSRESIGVGGLPDGKAWYAYRLRFFTTTDLTPDQIHELGLSEVKRIRAEIDKVIAAAEYKGTFEEFANYLRTDPRFFHEKPEDVVKGYRDIVKRIDPELTKLFGKLPRLPYGVKAMAEEPNNAPSALYANGTLAAGRPGWMLINTYDLKARPKWAMESLAAHEAVPGHHLQYALVEELGEIPAWRRWDVYAVFSEGWGLYAELLGEELGLYKDPYSKFGQLNNEIWRAIRLVVDTGIHAKGWTREQAVEYCRANSAKTEREIQNEIDRYIGSPGSVPCYKIGELKIRELRRYAETELGPKFDVRAFHDQILGVGQLPLDLLETRIKTWVRTLKK